MSLGTFTALAVVCVAAAAISCMAPAKQDWTACFDAPTLQALEADAWGLRFYPSQADGKNSVIAGPVKEEGGPHVPDSKGEPRFYQYKAVQSGQTTMEHLDEKNARAAVKDAKRDKLEPWAVEVGKDVLAKLLAVPGAKGIVLREQQTSAGMGTFELVPVSISGSKVKQVGKTTDVWMGSFPCPTVCPGAKENYLNQ